MKDDTLLTGYVTVRALASLSRYTLQRTTGLGYKKFWKIGDKVIERPAQFKTRQYRFAFEEVGRYLTDALKRDRMLTFSDRSLTGRHSYVGKRATLKVWHDVLDYFVKAGVVVLRWELELPLELNSELMDIPYFHGPNGEKLVRPTEEPTLGGMSFDPCLLTNEQKQELIGKPYSLSNRRQESVTVAEKHFRRIYVRLPDLLSEEAKKDAAERIMRAIALSHSKRK